MKKYWEDPYTFSFEAQVLDLVEAADKIGVILEETYFYPEGGGQPADRGTIASFPVTDVQEIEGRIVHYLPRNEETANRIVKGALVSGQVDREFRIHNMRIHTGSHILFGAARKLFDQVGYAGFNIGEVGNLYLETPKQIRSEDLRRMTRIANEVVVENRPVVASFVGRDDAVKMKELAYNLDLPEGEVRIIDVEGWDTAACSGTHVRRTSEIGPIKIVGREVHKKNVTRIDFAIGKMAVNEIARDEKILAETAEFLSTSKEEIPSIVQKLSTELQAAQKDLRKMRERLVGYKVDELKMSSETMNGICVITDVAGDLDGNTAKTLVTKLLNGSTSTLVAVVAGSGDLSIVAGCSPDLQIKISEPVVNIAKKYGGGGGGRPNFVTAGGVKWDADTLLSELKEELIKLI